MLYNYLLFFLGIYSWNYKSVNFLEKILQKKQINQELLMPIKNNKKLIEFMENDSNSPNLNLYMNIFNVKENTTKTKIKLLLYNLYSFLIFIFLCIQPVYLLYKLFNNDKHTEETFITFLINVNVPINYIWAKYYFSTNHFDLYNNTCKYNCLSYVIIILLCVFISIMINLLNIDSFYNNFYYINYLNKYLAIFIVVLEWIYTRTLFALTSSAFTIIFCNHVNQIKNFISKIILNEFDMEDTHCLGNLIRNISNLRHSVEISIAFYNKLLSTITITGSISLSLFIRHKYIKNKQYLTDLNDLNENYLNNTNYKFFEEHDYYLIHTFLLYLFLQLIFFWNVIYYSELRNRLIKLIQSPSFINKFLTRWSTTKIKNKCKDSNEVKHLLKIILCIEEENATTIDWIILDKLSTNKWMDFSILGISTQDGSLIKKVITFSSLIYFVLSYLNY